jgi:hypothetical protein
MASKPKNFLDNGYSRLNSRTAKSQRLASANSGGSRPSPLEAAASDPARISVCLWQAEGQRNILFHQGLLRSLEPRITAWT